MVDKDEVVLIDGYGFVFRAYYSMPPLTRSDGTPVGALYGFLNMLLKLHQDHYSPYVAVILDAGQKNFRHELYKEYKANREAPPEDLIPQFPLIRDAARSLNLPVIEKAGYEADDIIATFVKTAKTAGKRVTIISSDKDLMQLIDEDVQLFDPMKSKSIGIEEVIDKFGVPPEKVGDLLALMGDSSDNIPGVPSIGLKTAAELLNQFGTLHDVLESTDSIKQKKRKEMLERHKEDAILSRKLVELYTEVPLDDGSELDLIKRQSVDLARLSSYLQLQGFTSLITRAEKILGGSLPTVTSSDAVSEPSLEAVTIIKFEQDLKKLVDMIILYGIWSLYMPDKENPLGIAIVLDAANLYYIPLNHQEESKQNLLAFADNKAKDQLALETVLKLLTPLLEDTSLTMVSAHSKSLMHRFNHTIACYDDVLLMGYCVDGRMQTLTNVMEAFYPSVSLVFEHTNQTSIEDVSIDFAKVAFAQLRLRSILHKRLIEEGVFSLYQRIENPLAMLLYRMEEKGIVVDKDRLVTLSEHYAKMLKMLEAKIFKQAGQEFNIASPKQLGEVLFDKMQIGKGKKTKTGAYQTGGSILEELAVSGYQIAEDVINWRMYAKLKNTYSDALQQQIAPKTGRVHTTYQMTATNTGRLSSIDPNLQNIPIRTDEGLKLRSAFIASEGMQLISVDYSQIELRLLAHIANIQELIIAFKEKRDIHAVTASEMFHTPLADVDTSLRRKAKAINFGIIYGISAFGLAKQLGIGRSEAQEYIQKYLTRYKGIKQFMDDTINIASKQGFVTTLMGRKIYTPMINDRNPARQNFAKRAAINAPLQGSASDIMKKAMVEVNRYLHPIEKANILLQVHDEIILEVESSKAQDIAEHVATIMQKTVALKVPLEVGVGIGDNWEAIH